MRILIPSNFLDINDTQPKLTAEMTLAIIDEHTVPNRGFRMVHPIDGRGFRFHHVAGLTAKYREHCRVNGYAQPSDQQIIDNICANTAGSICFDSDMPPEPDKIVGEVIRLFSNTPRYDGRGLKRGIMILVGLREKAAESRIRLYLRAGLIRQNDNLYEKAS